MLTLKQIRDDLKDIRYYDEKRVVQRIISAVSPSEER